jgi:glycine cleavage system H protein
MSEDYPQDCFYSETHEWARVEGDVVTVGLTKYAVKKLGLVIFVNLPAVGSEVLRDKYFAEVEIGRTISVINAPVDGVVVEVNEALSNDPALVSYDPYGGGWLAKIKMADRRQLEGLLYADEYKKFLKECGAE